MKDQLDTSGYVIEDIVSGADLDRLHQDIKKVYGRTIGEDKEKKQYRYGLFNPEYRLSFLHGLLYSHRMLEVVKALIGPDPVLQNALLIVSGRSVPYKMGWHRDVLQIPPDRIDERMFSPKWFNNCLQLNLAIYDDSCLWIVPGSHCRANTEAEWAAFEGSWHESPLDARMPGGRAVDLTAGTCVFYNNNLIHRGYNATDRPRMTLHASYLSPSAPPTWHFHSGRFGKLDPVYADTLHPALKKMYDMHRKIQSQYPDVEASYRVPADFVP